MERMASKFRVIVPTSPLKWTHADCGTSVHVHNEYSSSDFDCQYYFMSGEC